MTRALAVLAVLSVIAGCGGHDSLALWRDDLESECNGAPCGWTQIAGPAGAASYVETVPSEHGISLVGSGVAVSRAADGSEPIGSSDTVRSLRAHVVARCDTGSELTIIVTVTGVSTGGPIDVSGSATFPPEWDGSRSMFPLFPDDTTDVNEQFSDITNVVIHKSGAGACEVDYISLADTTVGFPE